MTEIWFLRADGRQKEYVKHGLGNVDTSTIIKRKKKPKTFGKNF